MKICNSIRVVTLAASLAIPSSAALAQETRAATIADAQAAKAEHAEPYASTKAERIALAAKHTLVELPNGLYPWFDSVYSGGGFTLGAGYRHFYGDRTSWDARGLLSAKSYKRLELATVSPGHAHGRLDLSAIGGWKDATQVSYFGLGTSTTPDDKANYRMQEGYVGGSLRLRGPARSAFDAGLLYEDYTLESGQGSSPSIEDTFTAETAPGLGASPAYLHTTLAAGFDLRPAAGYARRGGLYQVSYESFVDNHETYSFDTLQGEVVQHIPVLRENWVLSLHGAVRTTLDDADTVPYFLLPSLGSGSTLRGYPSWRFRDRHSLLLSGEWRWIPNRLFLDMALFYDAGKVVGRREDLNFAGLKTDVGVGARFHTPVATPLRIDVAHGSEGFNIVLSGAAAF